MNIKQHKKEFEKIIKKYNLEDEKQAEKIADFLTKSNDKVSAKEFAEQFQMSTSEAKTFLSFIEKGIKFKEEHIDKHN